ncbi:hypothetical protein [Galbitalea soli]|uniref:Uncharacterized protein n=1 Tax=Galbitalea soli TaxID=1268042 RepID=A0A7C9PND1_9MICO|nr:hypothetical protein [Galbitalea soli]NEM91613.1 hypothetical protein [Galbitalea soli]NYJ30307.1 hypothetical protein [Galbitalea soli]
MRVSRDRLAMLGAEVDAQRLAAQDRATSVQNKASFLVLAAGLLAGSNVIAPKVDWLLSTLPLLFTLVTVVAAAVALWPADLRVIEPRLLKDKWLGARESDIAIEGMLLEAKVQAYEYQQARTTTRVRALKTGFVFFVAAVTATLLVVLIGALG